MFSKILTMSHLLNDGKIVSDRREAAENPSIKIEPELFCAKTLVTFLSMIILSASLILDVIFDSNNRMIHWNCLFLNAIDETQTNTIVISSETRAHTHTRKIIHTAEAEY